MGRQLTDQETSDMPAARRSQEIHRDVLSFVSKRIGASWKDLLRNLGLEEYKIDAVEQNSYSFGWCSVERSFQGLQEWINSRQRPPVIGDLLNGLERCRPLLANALKKEFSLYEFQDGVDDNANMPALLDIRESLVYCPGREDEIATLVQSCSPTSENRLTLLVGLPGIGKSRILKATNRKLEESFPNYLIFRPTISSSCDTLDKIGRQILAHIDPSQEETRCSNAVNKVMHQLQNIRKPFLLILDISHIVPNTHFWEDIWEQGSLLLRPSKPSMRVLISLSHIPIYSHMDLPKRKIVFVRELGQKHSVDYLRSLSPKLSVENAIAIHHYCGGIPFVLHQVADYFKSETGDIDALVTECTSFAIPNCSFQSILRDCIVYEYFKILFDSMDKQYKHALIKLSVISGTFDQNMAVEILGQNETALLSTLRKRYLLLEQRGNSYYLHQVFKEFIDFYIKEHNSEFHEIYNKALLKYVNIHLDLLYSLNAIFMNSYVSPNLTYVERIIDSGGCHMICACCTDEDRRCYCAYNTTPCRCVRANIAFHLFDIYESHILYCLRKSLLTDLPDLGGKAIDCVSSTVSFLNKSLPYNDFHKLLEVMYADAREKNDKLRLAYLLVAIAFILMANVGVKVDSRAPYKLLSKARDLLEARRATLKKIDNLEVLAHCYSKLGRVVGYYLQDQEEGVKLIKAALKIRRDEIKGDDNIVLQAATYVDLAHLCRDFNEEKRAIEILEEHVIPVYRRCLWIHPFTASTLRYIGNILHNMGKYHKAELYYHHVLVMQSHLMSFRGDMMSSHRDLAKNCMQLENYEKSKIHLELAVQLEQTCFEGHVIDLEMHNNLAYVYGQLGEDNNKEECLNNLKKLKRKANERKPSRAYERNCSRISIGGTEEWFPEEDEVPSKKESPCELIRKNIIKWTVLVIGSSVLATCAVVLSNVSSNCPMSEYLQI